MADAPTTEMIRARYKNSEGIFAGAAFDRWLTVHDVEVRDQVLEWIRDRAREHFGITERTDSGN